MSLTKHNSIKSGRKWKRCGNISKFLKLENGVSNRRPAIDFIKEYEVLNP